MLSATRASKLDHYKLETTFHADQTVTHTTYKADLAAGERKTAVRTKWTEKRKLGSGGFGIVVLQESESGQLRAVKKLPQGLGKIDYSREVKVLSKVADRQDHFVLFFGWYENRDFVFIAMEYIEHGDLSQYLKSPDSRPNAREITRQLLEGLTILHDKKICHRDLKPQNILIASPHPIWVKIADFGVSKHEENTGFHTRLGTQGYSAPEVLGLLKSAARMYTYAVDMWALGCVVHEILTTETPFLEDLTNLDTLISGLESAVKSSDSEPAAPSYHPETDLNILKCFCDGNAQLPIDSLRRSHASDTEIQFVRSLLIANPQYRPAAKAALQSPWLLEYDEKVITMGLFDGVGINIVPPSPAKPSHRTELMAGAVPVRQAQVEIETAGVALISPHARPVETSQSALVSSHQRRRSWNVFPIQLTELLGSISSRHRARSISPGGHIRSQSVSYPIRSAGLPSIVPPLPAGLTSNAAGTNGIPVPIVARVPAPELGNHPRRPSLVPPPPRLPHHHPILASEMGHLRQPPPVRSATQYPELRSYYMYKNALCAPAPAQLTFVHEQAPPIPEELMNLTRLLPTNRWPRMRSTGVLDGVRKLIESISEDFGSIVEIHRIYYRQEKIRQGKLDEERRKRLEENGECAGGISDEHDISPQLQEFHSKAREAKNEFQVYCVEVFEKVCDTLQGGIGTLTDRALSIINDEIPNVLMGKERRNYPNGVGMVELVEALFELRKNIEIRHENVHEAVIRKDRRLMKTATRVLYAHQRLDKLKRMEKAFGRREGQFIHEAVCAKHKRTNQLLETVVQCLDRGYAADCYYVDEITTAVNALIDWPGDWTPLKQGMIDAYNTLQDLNDTLIWNRKAFHTARVWVILCTCKVALAEERLRGNKRVTIEDIKNQREQADLKSDQEMHNKVEDLESNFTKVGDKIMKRLTVMGVIVSGGVCMEPTDPRPGQDTERGREILRPLGGQRPKTMRLDDDL